MSAARQPVAPSAVEYSVGEVAQLVLGALRTRARQFRTHKTGVGSPVVTRAELVRVTGVGDRTVRAAIEELRVAAWPVVSTAVGAGYWLTDDPDEVAECMEREFLPRIRSHARVMRGMRRAQQMLASLPERQGTLEGVL